MRHVRLQLSGGVQGVGFRPYIYRIARELNVAGWVCNSPQGVIIDAEGDDRHIGDFIERIDRDKPPHAFITRQTCEELVLSGQQDFRIIASSSNGAKVGTILPDLATCPLCLDEILDPANRRFDYPFTNCTHCGPRYTILSSLPYDRRNTTMSAFVMCEACQAEYQQPDNRRFHAQPNACPVCGPWVSLLDGAGQLRYERGEALDATATAVADGKIVAVMGLGGFHLFCDPHNERAVQRLRDRKHRPHKPFAIMFADLIMAKSYCHISEQEALALSGVAAPIVLVARKTDDRRLSELVAPENPSVGALLAYTPLHHLLLRRLGQPVIATSGNRSNEPICISAAEVLANLGGIADLFLVHNRPILRPMDDSIVRIMAGRETVFRRARGFAPLALPLPRSVPATLAVGGHLKNTVGISVGDTVILSQHVGDLDNAAAERCFRNTIGDLNELFEHQPVTVAHDRHPDYLSTQVAGEQRHPRESVQHHYAHILSAMIDNRLEPPVLGICWDGTGYGSDGTIWGGEFLRIHAGGFKRMAYFRPFPLPGGEAAIREPRRALLGMLFAMRGDAVFNKSDSPLNDLFSGQEKRVLRQMLLRGLNSPLTSSVGRLFDGVSALLGLCPVNGFEGQAAMALEFKACRAVHGEIYPYELNRKGRCGPVVIDWRVMLDRLLQDVASGRPVAEVARGFHYTLADIAVAVARLAQEDSVVLSGGCFQNRLLTERVIEQLDASGHQPFWHRQVPPNDGGIALGQIAAVNSECLFDKQAIYKQHQDA